MKPNKSNRETASGPEDMSSSNPPEPGEPLSEEAGDEADDEDDDGEVYEVNKPWPNTYRDEDWEEGPPRVRTQCDEPEPRRPINLRHATPAEVCQAHVWILNELLGESHAFAMDYFQSARGVDDRVAARTRKLAVAAKLSTLARQLIETVNKLNNG